jgi:hypothetical protein
MADRRSLGIVGFFFGGVTAAVMLVAVMVVKQQIDTRTFDDVRLPVLAASTQTAIQ